MSENSKREAILHPIGELIDHGSFELALNELDKIIESKTKLEDKNENRLLKIDCVSYYIMAGDLILGQQDNLQGLDVLISKIYGLINQLKIRKESKRLFYSLTAQVGLLKYDFLGRSTKVEGAEGMYIIGKSIQDSIEMYFEALKICDNDYSLYAIRNNLANSLCRVGRFWEGLALFEENIQLFPDKYESLSSWCDQFMRLVNLFRVRDSISLYCVVMERQTGSLQDAPELLIDELSRRVEYCKTMLRRMGIEPDLNTIRENRLGEMEKYKELSEYRKFSVSNQLHLTEHTLFCKCDLSKLDDIEIGLNEGSLHENINNKTRSLNVLVNRLKIEFSVSRSLFYKTINKEGIFDLDLKVEDNYSGEIISSDAETLRLSYRTTFGILDKIFKGIALFYDIDIKGHTTYEQFFGKYKKQLKEHRNISLTALYSIALSLNKDKGSMKHFKKIRNTLEHEVMCIVKDRIEENEIDWELISARELTDFTLDLLKLTRSAIVSFIYLIRTETLRLGN